MIRIYFPRVMNLKNRKCDDMFMLNTDLNPSCSPEIIEDWFIGLKSKVYYADTTEKVMCIIDLAKDVKKKCQDREFTKEFIKEAYNEVISLAREKLNRIQTTNNNETQMISFSSGKRTSAFETIGQRIEQERKKLENLWI